MGSPTVVGGVTKSSSSSSTGDTGLGTLPTAATYPGPNRVHAPRAPFLLFSAIGNRYWAGAV